MKCPLCDICCVQKKQFTIDSTGIASDGDVRQYPAGQERLDRIEAVWQRYTHIDNELSNADLLCDKLYVVDNSILYDLWQAIRRDE